MLKREKDHADDQLQDVDGVQKMIWTHLCCVYAKGCVRVMEEAEEDNWHRKKKNFIRQLDPKKNLLNSNGYPLKLSLT